MQLGAVSGIKNTETILLGARLQGDAIKDGTRRGYEYRREAT